LIGLVRYSHGDWQRRPHFSSGATPCWLCRFVVWCGCGRGMTKGAGGGNRRGSHAGMSKSRCWIGNTATSRAHCNHGAISIRPMP